MIGVLYSSKLPSKGSYLRCHFLSGISPSLVLSEDMETIEKRFIRLSGRLRALLLLFPLVLFAGPGGGVDTGIVGVPGDPPVPPPSFGPVFLALLLPVPFALVDSFASLACRLSLPGADELVVDLEALLPDVLVVFEDFEDFDVLTVAAEATEFLDDLLLMR